MKREGNYDLLRVVSAIAIVSLHISASYLEAATNSAIFGFTYSRGVEWSCIYNVFARFAVPCFIMLAGAFALNREDNCMYASYYKKVFRKIYIPTIIFSVVYTLYSMILVELSNYSKRGDVQPLAPLLEAIKGAPFSHMWYLYMMTGVYLLVPVIIRVKNSISRENYIMVAVILMIVSSVGAMFSSNLIKWDPGFSLRFVAYFIFGDIIRSGIPQNKKSNIKAAICFLRRLHSSGSTRRKMELRTVNCR